MTDASQTAPPTNEVPNLGLLRISVDMIKFEHDRISFPAINAGVGMQVLDHVGPVAQEISAPRFATTLFVERRMFHTMFVYVFGLTGLAVGIAPPVLTLVECCNGDRELTPCTTFCFITHGKAMVSKCCANCMALLATLSRLLFAQFVKQR